LVPGKACNRLGILTIERLAQGCSRLTLNRERFCHRRHQGRQTEIRRQAADTNRFERGNRQDNNLDLTPITET
jgi:hypothetical protein